MVIALNLPTASRAKGGRQKRPSRGHAVLVASAMLNEIASLPESVCNVLNERHPHLEDVIGRAPAMPARRTEDHLEFAPANMPRWTLQVDQRDRGVDPDVIAETDAIPEKRPATLSVRFVATRRVLRVSDWQAVRSAGTIYRGDSLTHLDLAYFLDRRPPHFYCLVQILTEWEGPGGQDAWVTGFRVSLRKHKNMPDSFIRTDTPLPTIQAAFIEPLRQACQTLNRWPATAVELVDRLGGVTLPAGREQGLPGFRLKDAGSKKGQPSIVNPLRRSFRLPGTLFETITILEQPLYPAPVVEDAVPPEAPGYGPDHERFAFNLYFYYLANTPLIPTVADLARALGTERLYKLRDESVLKEDVEHSGYPGSPAKDILMLEIKPPGAVHPCGAQIAVAQEPGRPLGDQHVVGVRPLRLFPADCLEDEIEDRYEPYPPAMVKEGNRVSSTAH